ncbi:hypothetical protein [Streptomyces chiangmaiensis]|uniref:Uncharacterized protein n=1 Tax=Streptomyces chiangmaiensis TaxID=766497 RepID=A0ABU7FS38_9ACTN|nr:hypothetical protein [Streptomyces chiangmaiensis]MED7826925.1 hypothetical protein [Streptomyces chiangmaiensis]
MTRYCPVCWSEIPDVPSEVPLRTCSIACRNRLEAAAHRLLDAITAETTEPTDDDEGAGS